MQCWETLKGSVSFMQSRLIYKPSQMTNGADCSCCFCRFSNKWLIRSMRKLNRWPVGALWAISEVLINSCGGSGWFPAMEEVHVDPIRAMEETGQCQTDEDHYLNTRLVEAQTCLFPIKGIPLSLGKNTSPSDCYSILPGGDGHLRCAPQGPH